MKLAVLSMVRNEEFFIKDFIASTQPYVDKLLIADTGSTDKTVEIIEEEGVRLGNIHLIHIPFRSFLEHGFGWCRSKLLEHVPADVGWIHWLDADERIHPAQWPRVQELDGEWPYSIVTVTYPHMPGFRVEQWRAFPELVRPESKPELHIRSHPAHGGFTWRGYIHEELYKYDVKVSPYALRSLVIHHHFKNLGLPKIPSKDILYGFLLNRAVRNPELQAYTNRYWYDQYVPTIPHRELAETFRKICPEAEGL